MLFQELCDCLPVFHVAGHADMQRFQSQIQVKCALRGLHTSEVAHQLGSRFCDKCTFLAELLRVNDSVIGIIRLSKARELILMSHPVKMTAVYDGAADCRAVAVHIFGGGVGNDIGPPLDRSQIHRGRESIVNDQRNPVTMCCRREFLHVKHRQGRIGNGFTEYQLRVRLKRSVQFLIGCVRRYKSGLDPHLGHGNLDQIIGSAVDGGRRHDMAAALTDIEDGKKIRRLARGSQHARASAFHGRDLGCHMVTGRILQTGIEIAGCLQVKQLSHILTGIIFKSCRLDDRDLAGSAVLRGISGLHTLGSDSTLLHSECLLLPAPRGR